MSPAADIVFRIFTKIDGEIVTIAETFRSTLIVYPNLTSIPDANERYNFSLSDDNIIGYLRNVINPKAEAIDINTLKVTWENPVFMANTYPITVTVTAVDNATGGIAGEPKEITFDSAEDEKECSTEISELSANTTYSIWFRIDGAIGYSANAALISNARPKKNVTAIAFDASDNDFDYIVGDTQTFSAVFTPSDATVQGFSISEASGNQNVVIAGHDVTFNKYGEYKLVLTADDNLNIKSAEQSIIVHLPAPVISASSVSDSGIALEWNEVTDASKYIIYRNNVILQEVTENTYTDTDISLGTPYTYSIVAAADDTRFDSAKSDPTDTFTPQANTITINPAPAIESGVDFSSALAQIQGKSINDENPSLTINITGVEAIRYEWTINGKTINETGRTLTITGETTDKDNLPVINKGSNKSSNDLFITIVLSDGRKVSGFCSFYYESSDDFTVTSIIDTNDDERVVYGVKEKLSASFSRDDIQPTVTWTSDRPDIIKINPTTGEAESLAIGSANITATAVYNGYTDVKTINLESYMPAELISIDEAREYVILPNQPGVTITEAGQAYTILDLNATITAKSGNEVSGNITWSILNDTGSIASIDSETGVITPIGGGTVTIQASIDDGVNGINPTTITKDVKILQIQLMGKDKAEPITGQGFRAPAHASLINDNYSTTIRLNFVGNPYDESNFANAPINADWYFSATNSNECAETSIDRFYMVENSSTGNFYIDLYRYLTAKDWEIRVSFKDDYAGIEIAYAWFTATY